MSLLIVATLMGLQALLGAPAAAQAFGDCAWAPWPERPGAGAVGSIDPPQGNGFAHSLYSDYSYAGFVWHTYDQRSGPICGDPFAEFTTWVGNRVFDMAKLIVGTVNSLHYMLQGGGGVFGLDDIVQKGATAMYHGAALPYIAFALVLVAVALFVFALKGNLAATSKATARVLVGLWIMAATALTPLAYTALTDSILVEGVAELESNVYRQTIDQDVIYEHVLPDLLHRTVVVDNWAVGEFGSSDTDYAKKMTPELLDAQAWTRNDLVTGRDADDNVEKQKQDKFKRIAEDVKHNANYATFSGDGSSRIGASVFALGEAVCFGLFQLVCKIAILLAQLVIRLAILVGPVLGLLAFAPGVARTVARGLAGMLAQGLILTAAALVHSLVLQWILESEAFGGRFGKLVLMAIITLVAWKVIRPWRRLKNMASAAAGLAIPSRHEQRLEDLLRRHGHGNHKGNWFMRMFRRTSTAPHWGQGKGLPQVPKDWPGSRPEQPRPETAPVYDAEEMTGLVRSRRRGGFTYVDGEAWETHTPDSHRRPELTRARAGLPPGTNGGGRAEGSGDGRGSSGGGTRSESAPQPRGHVNGPRDTELPPVVDGEVVIPSKMQDRDRWLSAERTESQDTATGPTPALPETQGHRPPTRVFRPSTGRVENDPDQQPEPRPETGQARRDIDNEEGV